MSISNTTTRTIACNNPDCNKTITFDLTQEKAVFENVANVWLKSLRMIQTLDQRQLVYCSDICEITGARTGAHNLPEPKKIIDAATPAAVAAAAAAAEASTKSDEALKSGNGGPVIVP